MARFQSHPIDGPEEQINTTPLSLDERSVGGKLKNETKSELEQPEMTQTYAVEHDDETRNRMKATWYNREEEARR